MPKRQFPLTPRHTVKVSYLRPATHAPWPDGVHTAYCTTCGRELVEGCSKRFAHLAAADHEDGGIIDYGLSVRRRIRA